MANKKVNELIKRNNELRELLTPENKAYYEKILLYMRTYGIFYDDLEIEQQLMMILQDILEAQKNGESAKSFFGKNPKELLDEMKKQLDRPSWKNIFQIIGLVFLISSFFEVVGSFSLKWSAASRHRSSNLTFLPFCSMAFFPFSLYT